MRRFVLSMLLVLLPLSVMAETNVTPEKISAKLVAFPEINQSAVSFEDSKHKHGLEYDNTIGAIVITAFVVGVALTVIFMHHSENIFVSSR